ncbi:2-dehydro-3-deoxyphosphooctonate aldolase [Trichinella pseudospiralis]
MRMARSANVSYANRGSPSGGRASGPTSSACSWLQHGARGSHAQLPLSGCLPLQWLETFLNEEESAQDLRPEGECKFPTTT